MCRDFVRIKFHVERSLAGNSFSSPDTRVPFSSALRNETRNIEDAGNSIERRARRTPRFKPRPQLVSSRLISLTLRSRLCMREYALSLSLSLSVKRIANYSNAKMLKLPIVRHGSQFYYLRENNLILSKNKYPL